jgi:subtilisin
MVEKKSKLQRYIVMPRTGFDSPELKTAALAPTAHPVAVTARAAATVTPKMRVLDSISEDGPKLVEMSAEGELSLRLSKPELKIVPEVFYYPQWYRPQVQQRPTRKARAERAGARVSARAARAATRGSTITVINRSTGKPRAPRLTFLPILPLEKATRARPEPMASFG